MYICLRSPLIFAFFKFFAIHKNWISLKLKKKNHYQLDLRVVQLAFYIGYILLTFKASPIKKRNNNKKEPFSTNPIKEKNS